MDLRIARGAFKNVPDYLNLGRRGKQYNGKFGLAFFLQNRSYRPSPSWKFGNNRQYSKYKNKPARLKDKKPGKYEGKTSHLTRVNGRKVKGYVVDRKDNPNGNRIE